MPFKGFSCDVASNGLGVGRINMLFNNSAYSTRLTFISGRSDISRITFSRSEFSTFFPLEKKSKKTIWKTFLSGNKNTRTRFHYTFQKVPAIGFHQADFHLQIASRPLN